jgi:hypothetical protein
VAPSASTSLPDQTAARAIVGRVSSTINTYGDDRWDALRRARNYLLATMGVAGVLLYLIFWLAILPAASTFGVSVGAPVTIVRGALAIYLVGAIVGVFGRFQSASQTNADVDDLGLAKARLIVQPQLSGIAAILGVALTALAFGTSATGVPTATSLVSAFDVSGHPTSLVIAALFGLTPSLIIDRLKQNTEQTKEELVSIRPTET